MGFDPADATATDGLEPLTPAAGRRFPGRRATRRRPSSTAMGDAARRLAPAPDEWSANECVGHIIEADRRASADRIRRILDQNGVAEPGWDQLGVAAARRDGERPVAAILAEFSPGRDGGHRRRRAPPGRGPRPPRDARRSSVA